jgi:hypothetical protein
VKSDPAPAPADAPAPAVTPAGELERAAQDWIADYFNARHLVRTRDWLVALAPGAEEALRVAALTHDIERRVAGGPVLDAARQSWDDADYLREHSERSARIVSAWLVDRRAGDELVARVSELIVRHEIGGDADADLLQAADSLSFLEVNAVRARRWVDEGRCDEAQAQAKLDWMRDRIGVDGARGPAQALHERASATLAL